VKRLLIALLFVWLRASAMAEEAVGSFAGCSIIPTTWADGDSFRVKFSDGREETVRLYGADCIEWHVNDESDSRRLRAQRRYFGIADGDARASIAQAREFGAAAAARVVELLAAPFTVHTSFADGRGDARFQRIYAFVTTSGGEDLASVLVREGLARAFGVYRSKPGGISAEEYRRQLQDLELTAASSHLGIWSKTDWARLPETRRIERQEEVEISAALTKFPPPSGVDPNSASREELMLLPGVGEVIANRIIDGRSEGAYSTPGDLRRIRGISAKSLDAMSSALRFPGARVGSGDVGREPSR